jgi:26-hydroxylase
MQLFDEGFRLFTLTGAMIFLPFLKHLPGVASACKQLRANREEMMGFVRGVIAEHRAALDPENPKDLVDAYLIEIDATSKRKAENSEDNKDIFHGFDAETQMEQVVLDLFSAGVETLKTSLLWAIVYMLHNPEVMEKVQQELDAVVGAERLPTLEDMNNLPYTRATLYEIMRRSSVVPMGTTHATDRYILFNIFLHFLRCCCQVSLVSMLG